ncbi:MAG: R3H domain-containing nucleic acid-binding protein, partial [Armatimonadota bacterium]
GDDSQGRQGRQREREAPRRAPDHTQTAFNPRQDSPRAQSPDTGGGSRGERPADQRPARPGGRTGSGRPERRPPSTPRTPAPSGPREERPDFQPERPRQRQGADKVTAGVEERSDEALKYIQSILDAGDLGAQARIADNTSGVGDNEGFEIEIEGGKSDVLVGRQGQCLDALQFLIGIALNRRYDDKVRVTLEAAGYRRKHRETLEQTALDLAEQVLEHQQEAELEPLPARDRRIIHNILKEHPGVYTYSEGEGEDRHVIISPKEAQ